MTGHPVTGCFVFPYLYAVILSEESFPNDIFLYAQAAQAPPFLQKKGGKDCQGETFRTGFPLEPHPLHLRCPAPIDALARIMDRRPLRQHILAVSPTGRARMCCHGPRVTDPWESFLLSAVQQAGCYSPVLVACAWRGMCIGLHTLFAVGGGGMGEPTFPYRFSSGRFPHKAPFGSFSARRKSNIFDRPQCGIQGENGGRSGRRLTRRRVRRRQSRAPQELGLRGLSANRRYPISSVSEKCYFTNSSQLTPKMRANAANSISVTKRCPLSIRCIAFLSI